MMIIKVHTCIGSDCVLLLLFPRRCCCHLSFRLCLFVIHLPVSKLSVGLYMVWGHRLCYRVEFRWSLCRGVSCESCQLIWCRCCCHLLDLSRLVHVQMSRQLSVFGAVGRGEVQNHHLPFCPSIHQMMVRCRCSVGLVEGCTWRIP